jgi:hypothetical protein
VLEAHLPRDAVFFLSRLTVFPVAGFGAPVTPGVLFSSAEFVPPVCKLSAFRISDIAETRQKQSNGGVRRLIS